ncbi:MAG: hypothetical protein DWP97_12460, partial [Calditrichaeota bacterium]
MLFSFYFCRVLRDAFASLREPDLQFIFYDIKTMEPDLLERFVGFFEMLLHLSGNPTYNLFFTISRLWNPTYYLCRVS